MTEEEKNYRKRLEIHNMHRQYFYEEFLFFLTTNKEKKTEKEIKKQKKREKRLNQIEIEIQEKEKKLKKDKIQVLLNLIEIRMDYEEMAKYIRLPMEELVKIDTDIGDDLYD